MNFERYESSSPVLNSPLPKPNILLQRAVSGCCGGESGVVLAGPSAFVFSSAILMEVAASEDDSICGEKKGYSLNSNRLRSKSPAARYGQSPLVGHGQITTVRIIDLTRVEGSSRLKQKGTDQ